MLSWNINKLNLYIEKETSNKFFESDETDTGVYWLNLQTINESDIWNQIKKNANKQHGIYIFFDTFEKDIYPKYIGQTSNIVSRLIDHNRKNITFYKYVLFINSYLYRNTDKRLFHENLICNEIKNFSDTFEIKNKQLKYNSKMNKYEENILINQFETLKFLIKAALPYDLFKKEENNVNQVKINDLNDDFKTKSLLLNKEENNYEKFYKESFYLNKKDNYNVVAKITESNKVKILKNSWFTKYPINKINLEYQKKYILRNIILINKLLNEKIIIFENDKYIFIKEYFFKSLSGSVSFFVNNSANGKYHWKTKDNQSFKELYE